MISINADGKATLWTAVVFAILAGIAVGLRLISKTFTKAAYGADDWWALASLVLFYVWVAVAIWGVVQGGGGADIGTFAFDPTTLKTYLMSLFLGLNFYLTTVTAVKFSILCLYRRIFSIRSFRRASLVTGLFVSAWFIAVEVAALLSCRPVPKFWYRTEPGYCFNFNIYFLGASVAETILDTVILTLPVHMISTLQLSRRNKAVLVCIFLLGGFVIITGIVRIIIVYQPHSNNVSFTKSQLWSNIHIGTAIVCACLPTYRPLLAKASSFSQSLRLRYGSIFRNEKTSKVSKESKTYPMDDYVKKANTGYNELSDSFGDGERLTRRVEDV